MRKPIFIFTMLIVTLLVLFQLSKYRLVYNNTTTEIIITLLFLSIELFINKKIHPQINVSESLINKDKIKALSISKREYDVLQRISKGFSNREMQMLYFCRKAH
jgi:ATP/maltotriose-dependent transcriptional regulator MalT